MRKKILLILFFLFFYKNVCSQGLSLNDLTYIQNSRIGWSDEERIDKFLKKKGTDQFFWSRNHKSSDTRWILTKKGYTKPLAILVADEDHIAYQDVLTLRYLVPDEGFKILKSNAEKMLKVLGSNTYTDDNYALIFTADKEEGGYRFNQIEVMNVYIYALFKTFGAFQTPEEIKAAEEAERLAVTKAEDERRLAAEEEQKRKAEEERQKQINVQYSASIAKADKLLAAKQYDAAKKEYENAARIKPEETTPSAKISEIGLITGFLKERDDKVYNYQEQEKVDYDIQNSKIIAMLKETLIKDESVESLKFSIIATVDTAGKTTAIIARSSYLSFEIRAALKPVLDKIKLKPVELYGYKVFARAEFTYEIEAKHFTERVKNTGSQLHCNDNLANYSRHIQPRTQYTGKYLMRIDDININRTSAVDARILSYKSLPGPSAALLSVLVPGLGTVPVSGGKVNQFLIRSISTYTFIGLGIGAKFVSDGEYKHYHEATTQEDMDKYYDSAKSWQVGSYLAWGIAGSIWLCDIIDVMVRGAHNKKQGRMFRQSNFSVYYEPQIDAPGIYYSFKF